MTTPVEPVLRDDPWLGANPLDPAFRDDPHPALARLRALAPVHRTPLGLWRLTRYVDCVRLLRDVPCGVRTTDGRLPGVDEAGPESQRLFMLQQDPPAHTRLRRLVSRAFTPRAVLNVRPSIERVVAECLDRIEARGSLDVIADLALPVPSTVICEMLGVPLEDRERFTLWTAQATHGLAAMFAPPEVLETARQAAFRLAEYFEALFAARRERPTEDLLAELLRAEAEGDRLSHPELLSQSIGLLIAGFETTIGLIGNGVRQLLLHEGELARLRAHPELVDRAVEECLRFDGPIILTQRILHADAEIGGHTLPKNAVVLAMLAAANRDPEVFDEPQRFDVARDPNPHLAFGGGAHLCLGAHLARLEARIAIGRLVERFPKLALESEKVEWGPSLFRVPGRLPVSLG
jgi:cytochrome P450